jgi:hypothetical protein
MSVLSSWQSIYSDSTVLSTATTTLHIVALLVGGGLAIAADRTTLRALRHEGPDWPYHLQELHAVHRPVLSMIAVLFITGIMMALADLDTFLASPYFWIKLGLVVLLLGNGIFVYNTEGRLASTTHKGEDLSDNLCKRLTLSSRLSVILWILTTIAGCVLASAA